MINEISHIEKSGKKYKKQKLINMGNTVGKIKRFDPNLHSKYDVKARDIIKNIFPKYAFDNDNLYGEDLIFKYDKIPYKYIEVQVCSTWETSKFPYQYPFVYARKMRFNESTLFITFNKFYTEIIMFGKRSLNESPSRLQKYDREMVYYVPWRLALKTTTDNLTIRNIMAYAGISDSDIDSEISIDNDTEKIDK